MSAEHASVVSNSALAGHQVDFSTARYAVIGAGKSGLACVEVLRSLGCEVRGYDDKPASVLAALDLEQPWEVCEPQTLAAQLSAFAPDVVVVSPGVPPRHESFRWAEAHEKALWGEIELAWRVQQYVHGEVAGVAARESLRDDQELAGRAHGPQWLAVTGTNGKTTTTLMCEQMLLAGGVRAKAVGNIGVPVVKAVLEPGLEALVVELSSFQLATAYSLRPYAALCLNLDEDHLDWHGSVAQYHRAKARVYEGAQKAVIYNCADQRTLDYALNADVEEGCRAIGIKTDVPDIYQLGIVEDLLVDRAYTGNVRKEACALASFADLEHFTGPQPSDVILQDALAAAALARAYGVSPESVAEGLRAFTPAPHRAKLISQVTGVSWINDSKATNAHAALASLAGAAPRSVVWIAGGDAKGQDFTELVRKIAPSLRGVVLIGLDRTQLRETLRAEAPQVPVVELEDHPELMMSAVHECVALSVPGNRVVLAPACASWDQFPNYQARGAAFEEAVKELERLEAEKARAVGSDDA